MAFFQFCLTEGEKDLETQSRVYLCNTITKLLSVGSVIQDPTFGHKVSLVCFPLDQTASLEA